MLAKDNPFRVERVRQFRFEPIDTDWPTLMARLQAMDWRAAIVGPEGSGKTTLLEDLAPRANALGLRARLLFLNRQQRNLPARQWRAFFSDLRSSDVILFDGSEQLGPLRWRWFQARARGAGGLVITTHRPGRLPTLIETRSRVETLTAMVRQLAPHRAEALAPGLDALLDAHHGNLRDALRALYDACANEPLSDADD